MRRDGWRKVEVFNEIVWTSKVVKIFINNKPNTVEEDGKTQQPTKVDAYDITDSGSRTEHDENKEARNGIAVEHSGIVHLVTDSGKVN